MSNPDPGATKRMREILAGRVLLLGFGLAVLSFLVVIDRPGWFEIHPATGTSLALSNVASTPAAKPAREADARETASEAAPLR